MQTRLLLRSETYFFIISLSQWSCVGGTRAEIVLIERMFDRPDRMCYRSPPCGTDQRYHWIAARFLLGDGSTMMNRGWTRTTTRWSHKRMVVKSKSFVAHAVRISYDRPHRRLSVVVVVKVSLSVTQDDWYHQHSLLRLRTTHKPPFTLSPTRISSGRGLSSEFTEIDPYIVFQLLRTNSLRALILNGLWH